MVSCGGFWFILLGDCVLASIIHFLIFLGICGIYVGLTLQGVLQAFVFGFPLSGSCVIVLRSIRGLPLQYKSFY